MSDYGHKRHRSSVGDDDRHSHRHRPQQRYEGESQKRDDAPRGERPVDPMPELPEETCVRIGVFRPSMYVTRENIMQEVDRVGLGHKISAVVLEGEDASTADYEWSRVYFRTKEEADQCVTLLNAPNRTWRWRTVVTQRLPLPPAHCQECEEGSAFSAFVEEPASCITVEAQEGPVYFSTNELFKSRGLVESRDAYFQGKSLRRLICKHFEPGKRIPCRYGADCGFLHVKAKYMNRLLRTVPHTQPLRIGASNEKDDKIQISAWEFERRLDTLIVRDLDAGVDYDGLKFMFEDCAGFQECFLREHDGMRYGVVRFASRDLASAALLQTFSAGLNISCFGSLEDIRAIQIEEARTNPQFEAQYRSRLAAREQHGPSPQSTRYGGHRRDDRPKEGNRREESKSSEDVPFPSLPEGWTYGVSRKNKYYFYQISKKEKTTWKHPVTNEVYSTG